MADEAKEDTLNGNGKSKRILFEAMDLIIKNLKENMNHLDSNFKHPLNSTVHKTKHITATKQF